MQPATDNYPLALLQIANKALIAYQIEHLERNGITHILIVVERKYANKIEKYLNEYFKASLLSEIELVVLSDEEESANVIKLLGRKDERFNNGEVKIDVIKFHSLFIL